METKKMIQRVVICILVLATCGCGSNAVTPRQVESTVPPTNTATIIPTNPSSPVPPTDTTTPEPTSTSTQIPATATEMENAINTLINLNLEKIDLAQSKAIDQAILTITSAGVKGADALKEKLDDLKQAGVHDIPFELLAGWMLWDIGNLDEPDKIAEIWSSIPSDEWIYNMLFIPGIQAAGTQDFRAVPLLQILTSDKKGIMPLGQHAFNLEYPLTHEFLWGSYGAKGIPVLFDMLQNSHDPTVLESTINLLSRAQYLPALHTIREKVNNDQPGVSRAAIVALGLYGHPDDFDLLIDGLDSADKDRLLAYVFSIIEYGDTRAVPYLTPLLKSDDQDLNGEVAWGLGNYLASPESLVALNDCASASADPELANSCNSYVNAVLDSAELTWDQFQSLTEIEQVKVTDNFRYSNINLKPGEEGITHDQILEVVAEWRETGRIGSEKWAWVETRHFLPNATPEDIDLLLDGKSGFYFRLSDECINEVRIVDDLVKWIGRSRYK